MTADAACTAIAEPLPGISTEASHRAVAAAVAHAQAHGWQVHAAVVDRAGQLMAFLRMPLAPLHSIDIAIDKAYTSASFGLPTSGWEAALADEPMLRSGLLARPRLVLFGGGLPIVVGNCRVGGVGVSGATAEQDEACAAAALAALGLAHA